MAMLVAGSLAAPARAATVFTGDTIQGVRVASSIDTADLAAGRKHLLFFQGTTMGTGQHWYVPVVVAKGARPGKRVMLVAGVHGDEVSPVEAVRRIMDQLDPASMSGTVVAVYDTARPAKEYVQRKWPLSQMGGSLIDMNRVWPGDPEGGSPPERQAGLMWQGLFKPNTDIALDFHTAATGGDFSAFIFADLGKPEVRAMAELYPIGQIKNDPGFPSTLETSFVEAGIPCLTIEIGGPRIFDRRKIPLFVEGTMNVLRYHEVIEGPIGRTSKDAGTFFGDAFHTIRATHGGWLELLVDLTDAVTPGQTVAIQRDSFGNVIRDYKSAVAGQVSTIQRDALIEPGTRVMQILHDSPDPKCTASGCYEPGDDY
jgi:hypothetical protein